MFLFQNNNSIRIILWIVGFVGAVFMAAWVPLIAMGLLALRWRAWEALVIGLWADFLWFAPNRIEGLSDLSFFSLPLFTLSALVLVWGLEPLRREFLTP